MGILTDSVRQRLQSLLRDFRSAWGTGADLASYLPPPEDPSRPVVLRALVAEDLEMHWRNGRPVLLERYLASFPELGRAASLEPELVFAEYRARHLYGDRPPVEAYRDRFPDQYGELCLLRHERPVLAESARRTVNDLAPATVSDAGPVAPEDLGNGYVGVERIGVGSFAEVWRALAPGGVTVAVKRVLLPVTHEDARHEHESLELIKDLKHPFLLQTHASWFYDDRLHIAMELADGTLRQRLKECRRAGLSGIPFDELIRYLAEAAEALDFLIDKQVLHRDLKPENVLTLKEHAKVADFGLAKVLQHNEGMPQGADAGTPFYMAPEVWQGTFTTRSDQYSLAVTYVELRLGRRPFHSADVPGAMIDHITGEPDLGALDESEKQVLRTALAKAPQRRFPSCTAFAEALRQAHSAGTAGPTPETGDRGRAAPTRGSHGGDRAAAAVVLLALVVSASAGILSVRDFGRPPPARPAVDWLPPGFRADGTAVTAHDGRRYAERLVRVRGRVEAAFVLVPPDYFRRMPAFYVMEDKVTNGQFRAAADDAEYRRLLADYHPALRPGEWEKELSSDVEDDLPVLRVTPVEAYCFARWLGGHLPSADQWDKAAGRFDRRFADEAGPFAAPFRAGRDVAVRLERPLPVGKARRDLSRYGCHDMAGNGFEWTRTLLRPDGDRRVPEVSSGDEVLYRGQSFAAAGPLLFARIKPVGAPAGRPPRDVGVRVVVEPSFED